MQTRSLKMHLTIVNVVCRRPQPR